MMYLTNSKCILRGRQIEGHRGEMMKALDSRKKPGWFLSELQMQCHESQGEEWLIPVSLVNVAFRRLVCVLLGLAFLLDGEFWPRSLT